MEAGAKDAVLSLLERPSPPPTVGELLEVLGVELDACLVSTTTIRHWTGALSFAIRYTDDPACAIGDLRVHAFCVHAGDPEAVLSALRRKGFARSTILEAYDTFGPWVFERKSRVLGWFADTPEWLSKPADQEARARALDLLATGIPAAESVADLERIVAQLTSASGIVRRGADAFSIDLAFEPPIPAQMLARAFAWKTSHARHEAEGWLLCDVVLVESATQISRVVTWEIQSTKPLSLGRWNIRALLFDQPAIGTLPIHGGLDLVQALDVVVSMRIASQAAPVAEPLPTLIKIVDAITDAPALPRAVGGLERAFGLVLTPEHLAVLTDDHAAIFREGLPAPLIGLALSWRPGEATPRALVVLRERVLAHGWSLELASGRAYVEARFRAAFGAPKELPNRQEFLTRHGRFVLSARDHREACTLGFLFEADAR